MERLYVCVINYSWGSTWKVEKIETVVYGKIFKISVPRLLEIMLKNPNEDWGDNNYPILELIKRN